MFIFLAHDVRQGQTKIYSGYRLEDLLQQLVQIAYCQRNYSDCKNQLVNSKNGAKLIRTNTQTTPY